MIKVEVIPCLTDNYAYLIVNDKNEAVLVDAPEAAPINDRIQKLGAKIEAVLITHHHDDHYQGLAQIDIGHACIYGSQADSERMPHLSNYVQHGDKFKTANMHFETINADGHTIGHIGYYLPEAKALFTADSLMFWGCGRLFEGTPAQMWKTLENYMSYPPETLIYSGHNYGVTNGNFAISLGGYIGRMEARLAKVEELNAKGIPVCPATLQEEMDTNPFLLARDDEYAAELGIKDKTPLERFTHIRKLRDKY